MKIEILGTGCGDCVRLELLVNEVLKELGRSGDQIERISDEKTIRRFMPLDEIPGMVIDGHLVSTRQLPEREIIKKWLSQEA